MNTKIKNIKAREILDSRGEPTVEVELKTDFGSFFSSVPSGVSKGKYEAVELRDGGKRYQGKGVLKAVKNVNTIIAKKIKGKGVRNQEKIDQILIELDGTKNKSRLGANAILPVSMAVCRAGAAAERVPLYQYISQLYEVEPRKVSLPNPCLLLVEGGLHANNELSTQEFMVSSQGSSFQQKFQIANEIYHTLGKILKKEYGAAATGIGLEGAFDVPFLKHTKECLDLILKAAKEAGSQERVQIFLDIAASSFFQDGVYQFEGENLTQEDLLNFYQGLLQKYPILAIEDPFFEDDWTGFQIINEKLGKEILIVGDDLLVTNLERIKQAQKKKACNAMILKPNQIGTVTETLEAAKLGQSFDWKIVVSHRAGETTDDFIADLAVGISADFIKAGAPAREERVAKYNRLLKIEEEIISLKK